LDEGLGPGTLVDREIVEDHDLSDFTFSGGQYALATRGTNDVLAQSYANGLALALVNGSDWTDYQRVEADITPAFSGTGGWIGLVVRYVDANNYYYAATRSTNTVGLYRRLNGVDTLLREGTSFGANPSHLVLTVDGDYLSVQIGTQFLTGATDRALRHGRAGLATFQARADFDDVRAHAAARVILMTKDYDNYGIDFGRPFTERGGDWQIQENESGDPIALSQVDRNGYALATIGTPVENQDISSAARVDSFTSSDPGAWFGLLGRFVDERNYYYVSIRNSNQIQIRKKVNGVITTLASANFTAVPGQYNSLRFRLIGDLLQLYVNRQMVASVHDSAIPSGQYGLATYRTAATWLNITVTQP